MNPNQLILLTTLFLVGCSGSIKPTLDTTHSNALRPNQSIQIAGESRQFHLYLPRDASNAPIVFLLHGNGGSSNQIIGLTGRKAPYKIWLDIARRENVILVVPDGVVGPNGKQGWNDCRNDARTNPDIDDVAFFSKLIRFVQGNYGSLTSRVFLVGTSNGGFMAMRLAEEIPEQLNGAAFVVASKPVNAECAASNVPLSVLFMNGTNDPITPYSGGQIAGDRGEVYSTADSINYWVNKNQTDTSPTEIGIANSDLSDDSTVKRYSYRNGTNNTVVEHFEVINGGHTEPSIEERYRRLYKLIAGNQNGDIEMADEIWNFFNAL